VRDLGHVIILAGGRMVEHGRHEQLLARRGLEVHRYGLQQGAAGVGKAP